MGMRTENKLSLKLLIDGNSVMSSFSFNYCQLLLDKLIELRKSSSVFIKQKESIERGRNEYEKFLLTPIAMVIVKNIQQQIGVEFFGSELIGIDEVDELISTTNEFLEIFSAVFSGKKKIR